VSEVVVIWNSSLLQHRKINKKIERSSPRCLPKSTQLYVLRPPGRIQASTPGLVHNQAQAGFIEHSGLDVPDTGTAKDSCTCETSKPACKGDPPCGTCMRLALCQPGLFGIREGGSEACGGEGRF